MPHSRRQREGAAGGCRRCGGRRPRPRRRPGPPRRGRRGRSGRGRRTDAATRSAADELRLARAVLEERRHPGLLVLGGEQPANSSASSSSPVARSRPARRRSPASPRPAPAAGRRRTARPIATAVSYTSSSGDDGVRQADLQRLLGAHRPAGEDQVLGLAPGPISRASRWVPPAPGMTPSRISGWPSLALSASTRKSARSASSHPPPSA